LQWLVIKGSKTNLFFVNAFKCIGVAVNFDGLIDKLRSVVSECHGVAASGVYLLQPRTIPKTSSGKIARQWVKKVILNCIVIIVV